MGENTSITIENSPSPIYAAFNNVKIFGCSNGWNTIDVKPNSTLYLFNNSQISDAATAVTLRGSNASIINSEISANGTGISSIHNSEIEIFGSEISNNEFGINSDGHAFIDIDNSKFSDHTESGIYLDGVPTLILEDSEFENNNIGMEIKEFAIVESIKRNIFESNQSGIFLNDSKALINLEASVGNENIFRNCNVGIKGEIPRAKIKHNIFEKNKTSIQLSGGGFVDIFNNSIGYDIWGIRATNGSNFRASNNEIGTADNFGFWGVSCFFSQGRIDSNDKIRGKIEGVRVSNSPGSSVINNEINITGIPNYNNAAIRWKYSDRIDTGGEETSSEINDNTITNTNTRAGIEVTASREIAVSNNTVNQSGSIPSGSSALISNGNEMPQWNYNLVEEGYTNGVNIVNTSNSTIQCNELVNLNKGLLINPNSPFHDILTNTLDGSSADMTTYSRLGIQPHHGNLWYGGTAEAIGLKQGEIDNSLIIYDSDLNPEYQPSNPNPLNLIEFQTDYENETLDCTGDPGSNFPEAGDICDHYSQAVLLQSTDQYAYWSNMYRLFSNAYFSDSNTANWPTCLQTWWSNNSLNCGIKEVIISFGFVRAELKGQSANSIIAAYDDVLNSIDNNVPETEINALITSLENLTNTRRSQSQNSLFTEKNTMQLVNCSSNFDNLWPSTLSLLYGYLRGDTLTTQDTIALQGTATLCVTQYGDPVNWARSIIEDFDHTRYDLNDDCMSVPRSKLSENEDPKLEEISIAPNPADDEIVIENIGAKTTRMELFSIEGRRLKSCNTEDLDQLIFSVQEFNSGIYFLKLFESEGDFSTHKIIVQH